MARIELADSRQAPVQPLPDDEIDLREVARALWGGRWLIAAIMAVALLLAATYLHNASYRYTATLTLAPAQQSSGFSGAARNSGLGSIASLAGVSLPQDSSELDFTLFSDGVHSRQLADRLARNSDLMHRLFAAQWDADKQQWRQPDGLASGIVQPLKALLGVPVYAWTPPGGAQLQELLQRSVKVETNTNNPFITLSFDNTDPQLAAALLDDLTQDLNEILRQKALHRATENIAYLSNLVDRVSIVEHRLAIIQALGAQERKRMLANSTLPYAADPIGSASASIRPTSPKPAMVLLFALAGGFMLGVLVVLVRHSLRTEELPTEDAEEVAVADAPRVVATRDEAPQRSAGL